MNPSVLRTFLRLLLSCMPWLAVPAAQALSLVSWNTEFLMDARQFEAWRSACTAAGWNDAASSRYRHEPLPPCDALSGQSPRGERQSRPLRDWHAYQAKLAALRARATELDADVLLLQEVGSADAVAQIVDARRYRITTTQGAAHTALQGAVAVKQGVSLIEPPTPFLPLAAKVQTRYGPRQLRPGLQFALRVRGQRVDVLALHLKSGCRSDALDTPGKPARRAEDCAQLRTQVAAVQAWMDAQRAQGHAFIVAGDFNRELAREQAEGRAARCDASEADAPLQGACVAYPWPEWNDQPAQPLRLACTALQAYADGGLCSLKRRRGAGKPLCHCGIDQFIASQSLLDALRLPREQWVARGAHYGLNHYGPERALPSDHCPLRVDL